MNIEFIEYKPTPSEKYLGIATVNFNNMIYLRYKVVPKKEGNGFFIMPASYKIASNGDKDDYVVAFVIDSNFASQEIERKIRVSVNAQMKNGNTQTASVFENTQINNYVQGDMLSKEMPMLSDDVPF